MYFFENREGTITGQKYVHKLENNIRKLLLANLPRVRTANVQFAKNIQVIPLTKRRINILSEPKHKAERRVKRKVRGWK